MMRGSFGFIPYLVLSNPMKSRGEKMMSSPNMSKMKLGNKSTCDFR